MAGNVESSRRRFERFRDLVLDDAALIDALYPIDRPDVFVDRVVALGSHHGFRFTAEDVQAAMREGGRAASGRWTVA